MSKNRTIKKPLVITLIIAITVLSAAAIIAFVSLTNKKPTATITTEIPLEETPSLGACQIVKTDQITSARFGEKIIAIEEGVRTGTKGMEGQPADSCSYAFSTSASRDNILTVAVSATPVASADEKAPAVSPWTEVAGTDPKMFFMEGTVDSDATTIFTLKQSVGGNVVLLTIRQPKNEQGIQKVEGTWLLVDLLSGGNTDVVLEKSAENAAEQTVGEGPGLPPSTTVREDGNNN